MTTQTPGHPTRPTPMARLAPRAFLPLAALLVLGLTLAAPALWLASGALGGAGAGAAPPAPPTTISAGTGPNNRPALGLSPAGDRLCAVWSTFDAAPDAHARLYSVAGGSWSPPLDAPATNLSRSPGENTQAARCAIDAAGNTHVVWQEGGAKRVEYRRLPAGADAARPDAWTPTATISTRPDAQWADLAAGPDGRVWLAYAAETGGAYTIVVHAWSAGGGWGPATGATAGGGHYPRIAVDDAGAVHVIYRGEGGIGHVARDPASGTWSAPARLPGSAGAYEQTGLATGHGGAVHAVYSADPGGGRAIYYLRKAGAGGWGQPVRLTAPGPSSVVPRIAAAGARLVMVTDRREGAGDLVYTASADGGASWGAPAAFAPGTTQGWPWVVMGPNGAAFVAWWHTPDNAIRFGTITPDAPPPPAPTLTPTATATAAATRTAAPTATSTATLPAAATATATRPATGTPAATLTPSIARTATARARQTPTATSSPAGTATPMPSATPSPTSTVAPPPSPTPTVPVPSPSPTITALPSPTATVLPTPSPSPMPTVATSPTPGATPTARPTATATAMPSPTPTTPPAPTRAIAAPPSPTATRPAPTATPAAAAATGGAPIDATSAPPSPTRPAGDTPLTLSVSTPAGRPIRIVGDGTGQQRAVGGLTQGANGGVSIDADGGLTYRPHPGFVGADRFTYTLVDRQGGVTPVAVNVTVTAVPDALPRTGIGGGADVPASPRPLLLLQFAGAGVVATLRARSRRRSRETKR